MWRIGAHCYQQCVDINRCLIVNLVTQNVLRKIKRQYFMFSLYMHIHLDKLDATGFASHVMVYCKYISVLLSIQSLLVPCKTLISKARHCLMPFLFKGHASINQSIATPHALLFKVVLQLCTSTYSSHANLFFTRLDKENRLTTQDTQS